MAKQAFIDTFNMDTMSLLVQLISLTNFKLNLNIVLSNFNAAVCSYVIMWSSHNLILLDN